MPNAKRQRVLAVPLFVPSRPSSQLQPGWDDKSWGFHSDDGLFHHREIPLDVEPVTFGPGDTVGCGLLYPPVSRRATKTRKARLKGWRGARERLFRISPDCVNSFCIQIIFEFCRLSDAKDTNAADRFNQVVMLSLRLWTVAVVSSSLMSPYRPPFIRPSEGMHALPSTVRSTVLRGNSLRTRPWRDFLHQKRPLPRRGV